METTTITFGEALGKNRTDAIQLLEQAMLPTSDIDDKVKLFVLFQDQNVIGTGGLEQTNSYGLLRSISVSEALKGKGYGQIITQNLENYAHENGIKTLYLLTTTAKDFFEKKCNYEVVERINVPLEIQNSQQFSSVCPSSAVVMKKNLV